MNGKNIASLLFLSAYLPSSRSPQAGQKTAFRHLRWLAERFRVSLVTFRNEAEHNLPTDELLALCEDVHVRTVTRRTRLLGCIIRPHLPLLVGARWSGEVRKIIRRLLAARSFERVHCEWSQMGAYLPEFPGQVERWISAHDILSQFSGRRARASAGIKHLLWRCEAVRSHSWERKIYSQAGTLLVQNPKDARLIRDLAGGNPRVKVVPPEFRRYRSRQRHPTSKGPALLFWGALGRTENSEAAVWLATRLLPELAKLLPQSRLILAGSGPSPDLQTLASQSVSVPGFVEDPQPLFDDADLAVLPLFRGAGVKVKVIECLVAGLPVFTGSIGAEGIEADEQDGLLVREPDAAAYATLIRDIWCNADRLKTLSTSAIKWGEHFADGQSDIMFS